MTECFRFSLSLERYSIWSHVGGHTVIITICSEVTTPPYSTLLNSNPIRGYWNISNKTAKKKKGKKKHALRHKFHKPNVSSKKSKCFVDETSVVINGTVLYPLCCFYLGTLMDFCHSNALFKSAHPTILLPVLHWFPASWGAAPDCESFCLIFSFWIFQR